MDRDTLFKAFDIYNEAEEQEPNITTLLKGIEEKTDTKLRRLEHKLKNPDRIYQKLIAEPDKKVRDALRYTFELDETKYVSEYKQIIALLGKEGYNLSEVKNYWKDTKNPYNGINTNVFTNGKYEFEVQYHTAETLRINEQMHKLYEKARTLNKRSAEAIKLQEAMINLSKNIPKPKGVDEV